MRVPIRPHFGVMGLAPKEADDVNSDIENIFSGTGDDTLTGNAAANAISGNAGDDGRSNAGDVSGRSV